MKPQTVQGAHVLHSRETHSSGLKAQGMYQLVSLSQIICDIMDDIVQNFCLHVDRPCMHAPINQSMHDLILKWHGDALVLVPI